MGDLLVSLIFGIVFVVLGRWMYRNPEKTYPAWVPSRADSHFYPRLVRVLAVTAIFVGSYVFIVRIAVRTLSPVIAVPATFVVACAGAWLLRPKSIQQS